MLLLRSLSSMVTVASLLQVLSLFSRVYLYSDAFVILEPHRPGRRWASVIERASHRLPLRRFASSSSSSPSSSWQEDANELSDFLLSPNLDCVEADESTDLYKALRQRRNDLQEGIGKRYVCRTQKGFLNIHKEPGDPTYTSNAIGTLQEGQIVTSTGPQRGLWVQHDGGGWSISRYGGFTWLEAIDE